MWSQCKDKCRLMPRAGTATCGVRTNRKRASLPFNIRINQKQGPPQFTIEPIRSKHPFHSTSEPIRSKHPSSSVLEPIRSKHHSSSTWEPIRSKHASSSTANQQLWGMWATCAWCMGVSGSAWIHVIGHTDQLKATFHGSPELFQKIFHILLECSWVLGKWKGLEEIAIPGVHESEPLSSRFSRDLLQLCPTAARKYNNLYCALVTSN